MEERGEELQNNGQAAKVARKQMQIGSELDYSLMIIIFTLLHTLTHLSVT